MNSWRQAISVLAVSMAATGFSGCFVHQDSVGDDPGDDVDPPPDSVRKDASVRPRSDGSIFFFGDGGIIEPSFDGSVPLPARFNNVVTLGNPPPAVSGGSLAITPDGKYAVAGDPDRDALHIVATADGSVRTVRFAQGSEPGRVVVDASGGVHLALRSNGSVVRVDLETAAVVQETYACGFPRGLAFDAAQNAVLVACANGELVTLDASSHSEQARVFIALDLRDVLVTPTGQRFVSRYRSAELLQLAANGTVQATSAPVDSAAVRSIPFELDDGGIPSDQLDPGFAKLGGQTSVTMSATLAWKTVLMPDGRPVMLHQQSQVDEVVISQQGGYGGGCAPITQPCITRYGSDGKPEREPARLGGGALIVDVAVSPDGLWYAIAKPGEFALGNHGGVEVLGSDIYTDAKSETLGLLGIFPDAGIGEPTADASAVLPPPINPGFAPDGGFVRSPTSCNTGGEADFQFQTTAVAFGPDGLLYTFSREPAQLVVYKVSDQGFGQPILELQNNYQLSVTSVADTGHDLFHTDVGSGLACASCHGEALDDGHIWNFRDFGPRRTQNIRGGLLQTLPLHWEGDLKTFKNLADEVMTRRMSGFQLNDQLSDALSGWIDQQPALRLAGSNTDAVARGKALFESSTLLCTTCHNGDAFTDNLTVDVGTGGLFQVPSLRGLGLRAPFMHDGCAATLAERFDPSCGGGDNHGHTSQLSDGDVSDLVAYLQTL